MKKKANNMDSYVILTKEMRILFFSLLFCISTIAFSQEKQTIQKKNKLEANLTFSFNSNGIAPIPAFSLDKPALFASVNFSKGRFSYNPILAYSLEAKPWFVDNWFNYKVIVRPKFELRTGINISTFFSGLNVDGDEILKGERYIGVAITGTYKFSPVSSIKLEYLSDNGQEPGTLSGYFTNIAFDKSKINLGEKGLLAINLMIFYINYDGNSDGMFFSPTISFSIKNIPFTLFYQSNQTIQSDIEPWPKFKWNVGVSYSL